MCFQPKGESWKKRSMLDGFQKVLDPNDKSIKNKLIDLLQRDSINKVLKNNKNKIDVIVDFGCGMGRFSECFSDVSKNYIGIDITEEMIDIANIKYSSKNRSFFLFDGLHIPLKNNSVDCICSVLVLQYVNNPEEFKIIVSEMKRVCKPNGIVVFIEQISDVKKEENYVKPFLEKEFTLIFKKRIRYGKSISSWLASRLKGRFSSRIWMILLCYINKVEVLFPPLKNTYKEKIFVFKSIDKNQI